jgi:cellulose biosynthesis protein BcsQ
MTIRFDQSLPRLVDIVTEELGAQSLDRSTFLRDGGGQLAVIVDAEIGEARIDELDGIIRSALGAYARDDGSFRDRDSFGAKRLINEGAAVRRIEVDGHSISFLDRRTVGADWLLPTQAAADPVRIAFASIKGGVGRSTALAVAAAYLSSRGVRVLAVDLDLEAPGIGTMLIDRAALPKYGTLDYLVENGINGIDADFMANFIGESFLGEQGAKVSVLPAIGEVTELHPAGALSKLSRAYLEDINPAGESISLTQQIKEMIERTTAGGDYDVVLIDVRAGLHETTAASLLGLGAEMLMFGSDEPQTFLGYNLLLSHIMKFHGGEHEGWRERVQFVHAKASADPDTAAGADERFAELTAMLYENEDVEEVKSDLSEDDFDLVWADDDGSDVIEEKDMPPLLFKVYDDSRYRGFNPLQQRSLLSNSLYEATFGELIRWLNATVPQLMDDDDVE